MDWGHDVVRRHTNHSKEKEVVWGGSDRGTYTASLGTRSVLVETLQQEQREKLIEPWKGQPDQKQVISMNPRVAKWILEVKKDCQEGYKHVEEDVWSLRKRYVVLVFSIFPPSNRNMICRWKDAKTHKKTRSSLPFLRNETTKLKVLETCKRTQSVHDASDVRPVTTPYLPTPHPVHESI